MSHAPGVDGRRGPRGVLGLMGAIEAEVVSLRAALADPRPETVLGQEVTTGQLEGVDVAVLRSGVGKVNAALGAVALRTVGADRIVFTGVAGGLAPEVGVGDLVVAHDVVQHDVDVTALGRAPGELLGEPAVWRSDDRLRAACEHAAREVSGGAGVHTGRIASGDQFIASVTQRVRIVEQFGALAAEMEGAAMAQACARMGVPWAVVRSISDNADGDAVADFPAFLEQAADRGVALARAVCRRVSDRTTGGTTTRETSEEGR